MNIKRIHFVGIKGVGMTPLAVIARQAGFVVTGSDVAQTYITDEILQSSGISPFIGFSKDHITDCDLVITTGAHGGFDNLEVIQAKNKDIPVWTQGQAVGEFMNGSIFNRVSQGISVTGCHGKTTTTAIIATLLLVAGKDPSWVIGTGAIPSLGKPGHFGKGDFFVAEADEYASEPQYDKTPKFLLQHPRVAVVTNIEYDHPDLYPTFDSLIDAYTQFIKQVLVEKGLVIACGDDPEIQKIKKKFPQIITYGKDQRSDYRISDIQKKSHTTTFFVATKDDKKEYTISVIGEHNVLNAVAAIAVGFQLDLSLKAIQKGTQSFTGTKRRLEYIGKTKSGAQIYDDYAHHPTEIQASLKALRDHFPKEYIICAFQSHTFSRTKLLFNEFSNAFSQADEIVMADIFPSAREPFDSSISSKDLIEQIEKQGKTAHYLPTLSDVVKYIQKKQFGRDTIIVTMGAGDIYQVGYKLKI